MSSALPARPPLDAFPYARDPASRPFGPDVAPGQYVFVQDQAGVIYVLLETEGHLHPRVLGEGLSAAAAGGLKVDAEGAIVEVDNFSGTFQFGPEIFPQVLTALTQQGGRVLPGCERPFSY